MSKDQGFAKQVIAAFEAAGNVTDAEVGIAGGPSTTYMTQLRKVADGLIKMSEPRSNMFRNIDNAAQWERGSARKLWRQGTKPKPSGASGPESIAQDHVERLEERLLDVEERLDLIESKFTATESEGTEHGKRSAQKSAGKGKKTRGLTATDEQSPKSMTTPAKEADPERR